MTQELRCLGCQGSAGYNRHRGVDRLGRDVSEMKRSFLSTRAESLSGPQNDARTLENRDLF